MDVAVVAFDGNRFNGKVAPALLDLQKSGTIRILDLTFIRKGRDGAVEVVEVADSEVAAAFERTTQVEFDLLSEDDLQTVAAELEPGSSALVLVWENTWAARLSAALRNSDGRVLFLERIPRDEVVAAITALDEEL
ncbi:hypothetical protein ASE03_16210 [Kitasatospora sp. Root187]|uniref:DUF6325 family protein n=1 Tax=Kitasatospora sp. Root187 TaxID=1736486 RepID=UPI00070CD52D|nr:DUF6325 family protein [Kitasatospora sp. Root187]KQV21868.1 hypothetical protein ASC99_18545 [Kitasatospora sp. Root107]KRB75708.1 hypothetical protein ASE03_16210 [Kitasatospora sp. Root187]